MKRYIDVRIDKDHCYYCSNKIIARQNENNATAIRIQLLEEMLDKWIYIEFAKPNGQKVCTPRLEVENGVAIFDIPNTLTDIEGVLGVEIVIRDSEDVVWKSFKKTYLVEGAINASETIEEASPDFITEAQELLDQIETGLTPTIGDNGNWFILDKDTGKTSRGPKGDAYIITEEDLEEVEANVKADMQPYLEEMKDIAETAESIAKGANQSLSFGDYATMINVFNALNNDTYRTGQNILIVTLNVPDLWVSDIVAESIAYNYTTDEDLVTLLKEQGYIQVGYYKLSPLETQKVDLTDYVKNTDYGSPEKAGIVKANNSFGVTINRTNGVVSIVRADEKTIDAKTDSYRPIVPKHLDYAVKIGMTTNQEEWTEEEKASARALLNAVGTTDFAGASEAGVVKIYANNAMGLSMNASGFLYIQGATEKNIDEKTNMAKPIVPGNLDYAVGSVLPVVTQAEYDALVEAGTVNEKLYYCIVEEE